MGFFDKIWKGITAKQQQMPKNEPIATEQIARGEDDRKQYFKWLHEGRGNQMSAIVHDSYRQKQQQTVGEFQVHLLKMPYANGFALTHHPSVTAKDFQFFFDWLKDRVEGMPSYRLINAERRIFDRANYVESKEKYYLKPIIDGSSEPPFNQQYGNILIEQVLIDKQPSYLKFVANIYSDRLYTQALAFDDLIKDVFNA